MASRKIEVQVVGDADSLKRALGVSRKEATKFGKSLDSTGRGTSKFRSSLIGVGKGAGIAGAAIGGGLFLGLKKATTEFGEAQKVAAQTNAVLKSTKGIANVTGKQVDSLADAISRKTGIDDEAIASAQNLLLTFKNVRNEAGKGNTFARTTRAAVDLSAAMTAAGKSMSISDATLQLGKALQDPEKGMTRLMRSGVDFTQAQKDQVTALMKSGETLKAQRIILKEVETQFKGSAAAAGNTMPGAINKAKVALGNFGEVVGARIAPFIERAASSFAKFVTQMQNGTGAGGKFVSVIRGVAGTVGGLVSRLRENAGTLKTIATVLTPLVAGFVAYRTAMMVGAAATGVMAAAQGALNAAMTANPIGLVIAGLVALGAGLTIAWKKSETFRNIVKGALSVVRVQFGVVRDAVRFLGKAFSAAFGVIKSVVKSVVGFVIGLMDKWLGMFSSVLRVAGKIPGVGKKFNGLADSIDRSREKLRALRDGLDKTKGKNIKVEVDLLLKDFGAGKVPKLFPMGDPRGFSKRIARAVAKRAKGHVGDAIADAGAGIPGGPVSGTMKKAAQVAKKFGLRISSGYRSPKHNAAVGGVPNSLHTHGSAANPGAIDLVGSVGAMQAALEWARSHFKLQEGLIHDVGSGLHLHLGFFAKGGKALKSMLAVVGEKGPELVSLPAGAEVHSHSKSKKMVAQLAGVIPGFAGGGEVLPKSVYSAINRAMTPEFNNWAKKTYGMTGKRLLAKVAAVEGGGSIDEGTSQTSSAGARGPFQFIASTRAAYMSKYGVDAWKNDLSAAKAAMIHLKGTGVAGYNPGLGAYQGMVLGANVNTMPLRTGSVTGGGRSRGTAPARKRERPKHGRSDLTLEESETLLRNTLTRAEGTARKSDDLSAIKKIRANLGQQAKKLRARLEKISRALKGKLKPSTRKRLLDERASIFGDLGTLAGERISLRDQARGIKTDKATAKREARERRSEALAGIKTQLGDLASQAAAAWRAGVEKGIDNTLKTKLAAIAGGRDSTALNAIRGRQSGREDAQNQRDLARAQRRLASARTAGVSPRRLEQLEGEVDEVQARILEKRIQAQEDAANTEADKAREGLDAQEANLASSLGSQLSTLHANLEQRKLAYSSFVNQVRAILGPFGTDFEGSADDKAAIGGVGGKGRGPSLQSIQAKDKARKMWKAGNRTGKDWRPIIDALGYDPRVWRHGADTLKFRAMGGPVRAGEPYVVGERGRELFIPGESGRVVSNRDMRKGGGAPVINFNAPVHVSSNVDADRILNRMAFKIATS